MTLLTVRESILWSIFGLCLVVSFVLSGMEAGVFALSRLRIRQQMRAGRRSATMLHAYLENPENFLWTILVGNTVANFLILGWLVVILQRHLARHPIGFALLYALILFLFYALSDLLPKMLFRLYPTRLTVFFARPFRILHFLLRPLVGLVEFCSDLLLRWRGGKVFTGHLFGNREELLLVMQESAQTLTSEERAMINRVLDLQTLTVRQVMLPLTQAATVAAKTPVSEVLTLGRERTLTRFPVWAIRDGAPRVIGLASLNALLYQASADPTRRSVITSGPRSSSRRISGSKWPCAACSAAPSASQSCCPVTGAKSGFSASKTCSRSSSAK